MIYLISWAASLLLAKIFLGLRVFGRENIPDKGAFIMASNHESNADPFILGVSLPCSKWFAYLAKKELFEGRFKGWYFRKLHAIPLERGESDPSAIKKVLKILGEGRPIVMFPEGTRSKGKGLQEAKPGVGFIVYKAGVPVVPAYIEGSYEAVPEGLGSIRRKKVNVFIGKPVYFRNSDKKGKELYQEISSRIMEDVSKLKEEYAGKVS
jgi:1-acyl-sn-glycerol-3-phosphate acyltransferase